MADGVNAAVERVDTPAPQPFVDLPSAEPQPQELATTDHPVLPRRQPRHRDIRVSNRPPATRDAFAPNIVVNASLARHGLEAGGSRRTCGARFVPNPSRGKEKGPQPAVAASGFDPFK
ncbi:MAG TPA: hypothetical protein VFN82_03080 [Solirubrobacterales bacterium]|nr:hypothetical protein [Solirubrobacterales bacterium]